LRVPSGSTGTGGTCRASRNWGYNLGQQILRVPQDQQVLTFRINRYWRYLQGQQVLGLRFGLTNIEGTFRINRCWGYLQGQQELGVQSGPTDIEGTSGSAGIDLQDQQVLGVPAGPIGTGVTIWANKY